MEKLEIMEIKSAYTGKKVFLTGHTGFKGSWLLSWLVSLGSIVKGYSLPPEQNDNCLYNSIKGNTLCDSIYADIRDYEKLKEEILVFQPDFIFHLAAQPLVRTSYEQPIETFAINADGTINLLNAVRFLDKPCIIVCITTDKVYQNLEISYPYKEDDKLGGYDPYSASKACAEIIISSYRNSYFNPVNYNIHNKSISSARAGNVIGGGDWSVDRIVPDIIRALLKNEKIVLRNPNSIRPWQHVIDPLYGYLLLGAKQFNNPIKFATSYNFGPNPLDSLNVQGLVEKSIEIWGGGSFECFSNSNDLHEAKLLQLDIQKATNELNWKPSLDTNKAIELTIEWYKSNIANSNNALQLILKQLESISIV